MKVVLVALATAAVVGGTVSLVDAATAGCCPTRPVQSLPFTGPGPQPIQGVLVKLGFDLTPGEVVGGQRTQDPGARGLFNWAYNPKTRTLVWRLSDGGFTSLTYAVSIHMGRRGENGPLLILLCSPCDAERKRQGLLEGKLVLPPEQAQAAAKDPQYLDVHTYGNPGGEIRGQFPKL